MCSSLVELPCSIGSLHKLQELKLQGCSKLEILPTNINLESLDKLNLTDCFLLKSFPEISTNIKDLRLMRTAIKEVPSTIKSWSRLRDLEMSYNENLKEFPYALAIITRLYFKDTEMKEIPPWVKKISHLHAIGLNGCKKLVALPQLSDSLSYLVALNCESLERLDCSFRNHPKKYFEFVNCFKLNKEARELIHTIPSYAVLPGREVPANFTYRATGSSIMVNLIERPVSINLRFKVCVLLVDKDDKEKQANGRDFTVSCRVMDKHKFGIVVPYRSPQSFCLLPLLAEHLLIFEIEADVTSNELLFEFKVNSNEVVIKECGVFQL